MLLAIFGEEGMSSETLTSPSSSLHAPPLPSLPFDLVVEILSGLPVRTLMQLRCVCKSWKSLISDSEFAKKQLCASMSITSRHHLILSVRSEFLSMACSLSSFFEEGTTTTMQLEYPPEINQTSIVHLVGSCHGILCFKHDRGRVLLWNPSIRKFTKLPLLEEAGHHSSFQFSFGYDNFSDSYKVVAVSCYETYVINDIWAHKYQVNVHTLGTNSWRKMQDLLYNIILDSGIFVSGTINWLAWRDWHPPGVILSLDFEKESYQELLLPDFGGLGIDMLDLGMSKDCLLILSHGDTFTDVWLMKEFGNKESWTKLFRVPTDGGYNIEAWLLYFSEDDQVLVGIYPKFVIYNSRDGTFKDRSNQNINSSWVERDVYLESLISPCF
ncbi:unnamed protein product [Lathyrus sativus]|nr:unnamed protein product [Lathyrus sativus]